ncbi:MAG: hypothetical protein Kow00117_06430 [Phototrophicales bacterium]
MSRQSMGRVGGKRRTGAALQWTFIGGVLGLGCSAIFVLSLLILGVLELGSDTDGTTAEIAGFATDIPLPTADIQGTVDALMANNVSAGDVQLTVDAAVATAIEATQQAQPTQAVVVAPPTATPLAPIQFTATPDSSQPQPVATQATEQVLQPSGTQGSGSTAPSVDERLAVLATTLVVVDGGTFTMGTNTNEIRVAVDECQQRDNAQCQISYGQDSVPEHQVTLDTFQVEQFEVTNEQYVAFLNSRGPGSHRNGCSGQKCVDTASENENSLITFDSVNYDVSEFAANLPVVGVTWWGAQAYCQALGRRLPTEAEWERAARGPNNTIYPWGNEWVMTYARTNRPDPTQNIGPLEVGSFPSGAVSWANGSIYDMSGNVAEWVQDWYDAGYYSRPEASGLNPQGPATGVDRVVRGGSWDAVPFFARAVHRQHFRPTDTYLWLGFRCAADYVPETATQPLTTTNTTGGAVDPASLGPVPPTSEPEVQPTQPVDARPGLPTAAPSATPAANPTPIPAVPPGG